MINVLTPLLLSVTLCQATPPPPPVASPERAQRVEGRVEGPQTDGLAIQVALDRAGFSPGTIDGNAGPSTRKALEAYKQANGAEPQAGEPTTKYVITDADAAGPYEPSIPTELPDQAKLKSLAYKDVVEALAERFHSTPALLKRLNPAAKFAVGEEIMVPNVEPMQIPAAAPKQEPKQEAPKADAKGQPAKPAANANPQPQPQGTAGQTAAPAKPDVVVTVSKSTSALTVADASGKVLMYAPVTVGSARDPLPIGEWKVNGVSLNPPFRYNPELFWDADPTHSKALIKPGPNNPVGLVWIDLSKEHYGIHGTPEPSTVGKTQSHGCVRLTNWDALKLAGMVKPGTKVVFKQ